MPHGTYGHSMVDYNGDLYVIGGYPARNSILKLTCKYQDCKWTKIKQHLKVGRRYTVAIPVRDALLNCKSRK